MIFYEEQTIDTKQNYQQVYYTYIHAQVVIMTM